MAFRPTKRGAGKKAKSSRAPVLALPVVGSSVKRDENVKTPTLSLPIPIRSDLAVQIEGIPFDLTKAEATKIANVVLAMATEIQ